MTEDTSENLRKFIESKDPAMIMMGLSMAKGSGVPEELLPAVLEIYMWGSDNAIRTKAEEVLAKHTPDELKMAKPSRFWFVDVLTSSSYFSLRPQYKIIKKIRAAIKSADKAGVGDEAISMICESLNDDSPFKGEGYPPEDEQFKKKRNRKYSIYEGVYRAAEALGRLKDKRAVMPLSNKLEQEMNLDYNDIWGRGRDHYFCEIIIETLGQIGDPQAIDILEKILVKELSADFLGLGLFPKSIVKALGKIGDSRAIDILEKVQLREEEMAKQKAEEAGNAKDKFHWYLRDSILQDYLDKVLLKLNSSRT